MAKRSTIVKNERKKRMAKNQLEKRRELKKMFLDTNLSDEEREQAFIKLQKLPRNGSPSRVRNRCAMTGRGRACLRKFGLSRIKFRELALQGHLPGVTKSSW